MGRIHHQNAPVLAHNLLEFQSFGELKLLFPEVLPASLEFLSIKTSALE